VEAALSGTAFNLVLPTIFIWEGVTQYISEEAVRRTLAFVGKSAPSSTLVFTYVLRSIIEGRSNIPAVDRVMDVIARQSPWIFGLEPSSLQDFLKPYGLALTEDAGSAEFQEISQACRANSRCI
jgi:O-methyltransferase involved in polyketide biosynthesis